MVLSSGQANDALVCQLYGLTGAGMFPPGRQALMKGNHEASTEPE